MTDYQDNPNAESEQFEGPPSELFDLLADRALFGLEEVLLGRVLARNIVPNMSSKKEPTL